MRIGRVNDPRYRMPAERRTFGGRVYFYHSVGTKEEIEKDAKKFRGGGLLVRIVKFGRKYAVYTAPPKRLTR